MAWHTDALLLFKRRLRLRRVAGLALLIILLAVRVWDPAPIEDLRLRSFDLYQLIHPRDRTAQQPVVIVDIDDPSLAAIGQWPWPRTTLARLITQLGALQVRAISFDVIFSEPDRSSPQYTVQHLENIDSAVRQQLLQMPDHDQVFAEAMTRAGQVVLGQAGVSESGQAYPPSAPRGGFLVRGPHPRAVLVSFPAMVRNIPALEAAAAGQGLLSLWTERDGIVRRVPLVAMVGDRMVASLPMELLRVVTRSGAIIVQSDAGGVNSVAVPGLIVPTDRHGRVWVNFGPHDRSRYVSAKDVLSGAVDPAKFAGRLILIGTSAPGLLDLKATPIGVAMPGVEVHAQLLESILTGTALAAPNYAVGVELFVIFVMGFVIIALTPLVSAATLLAVIAAIVGAVIGGSWLFYSQYRLLFDASFPVAALVVLSGTLILIGYFREQIDRTRIRSAFGQYLSPTLVEQLAQSPERLVLGGEERAMTVLFSDLRDFSNLSEYYRDDPKGLTDFMNRLLTPLTNAILEGGGTIDKYMGDAIMAFWNAPLSDPCHEINACRAVLRMQQRLADLNRQREAEVKTTGRAHLAIKMGIGVNTGRCVVGNMGSDLRFQYTVMGEAVNMASRFEGQTKYYGVPNLVGSRTAQAAANAFALIEVDLVRLKGSSSLETVYTIIGDENVARSADFIAFRDAFTELLVRYRKQDWEGAWAAIEPCRSGAIQFSLTELLALYSARIGELREHPPAVDWAGAYIAEMK